jgi:hypothetical protein
MAYGIVCRIRFSNIASAPALTDPGSREHPNFDGLVVIVATDPLGSEAFSLRALREELFAERCIKGSLFIRFDSRIGGGR